MTTVTDIARLVTSFVQAQLTGDRRAALALVADGVQQGIPVLDMQANVIRAAQEEIGRRWQANEISIAQEHLATCISQLALARLFEYAPRVRSNGKRVFVACVQGEQHDLPARLVADYLEHHGFTVRYFGPDVPILDLARSLAGASPDLLALSVTMTFNLSALRQAVVEVRAIAPAMPIAVGGHAIRWSSGVIRELGVHTADPDPASVVGLAQQLTGIA